MSKSRPIPPAAKADSHSLEMIRVWIAQGNQHCVLNIGHWEQHRPLGATGNRRGAHAWGVLLADMVQHIANAHESEYGREPREMIGLIRESLEIELNRPTSPRLGSFVGKRRDDAK